MTYQKPSSPTYDDALSPLSLSPLSMVRQEEAVVAKKKKLGTALAVGVAAGLLLLVVAGDYYNVGVATPVVTATGGATETTLGISCYTSEGTFNGWSCDNGHGPYRDGCFGNIGQFKTKGRHEAFETCYGLGSPDGNRCWSNSHYIYMGGGISNEFPCVPRDVSVYGNPPVHWYVTQPRPDGSCGKPCDYGFNEAIYFPLHNIGDDYHQP